MLHRLVSRLFRLKINLPVVFVVGPTGVGKSRLAIELSKKFNGEIISADSMQVYRDLDIITNKVTESEMDGVPHNLINFIDPLDPITVVEFRNYALPIIHRILSEDKLPVIVGGTMYWIESLLYEILIEPEKSILSKKSLDEIIDDFSGEDFAFVDEDLTESAFLSKPINSRNTQNISTEKLYEILRKVDSDRAEEVHPTNRRKIIRSIQVYQQTGKPHSEWLNEQKLAKGGSHLGGPLRFSNSIIFLLTCDDGVLNERIDDRVNKMLENGLVDELLNFHINYNLRRIESQDKKADYTEGIFQSIGFKEFHQYLTLSEEERASEKGDQILKMCILMLKRATRRYSRAQLKWIRNRVLKPLNREIPVIFELDCTNLDDWKEEVETKAYQILEWYSNKKFFLPSGTKPLKKGDVPEHMKAMTPKRKKINTLRSRPSKVT